MCDVVRIMFLKLLMTSLKVTNIKQIIVQRINMLLSMIYSNVDPECMHEVHEFLDKLFNVSYVSSLVTHRFYTNKV